MSSNFKQYYCRGGIGDCLQSLPAAIEVKEIDLYSHFKDANKIFEKFGVKINRFEKFEDILGLHALFLVGEPLRREFYPQIELPSPPSMLKKTSKIIGIHVEGSSFANSTWEARQQPGKNLSRRFVTSLVPRLNEKYPDATIYFFCSPERTFEVGGMAASCCNTEFYVISFEDIWDSLASVQYCDFVLGSDSCIKTMANILKIPTLVFVGNYDDPFRDEYFIKPYVEDGRMKVIKYSNIDKLNIEELITNITL